MGCSGIRPDPRVMPLRGRLCRPLRAKIRHPFFRGQQSISITSNFCCPRLQAGWRGIRVHLLAVAEARPAAFSKPMDGDLGAHPVTLVAENPRSRYCHRFRPAHSCADAFSNALRNFKSRIQIEYHRRSILLDKSRCRICAGAMPLHRPVRVALRSDTPPDTPHPAVRAWKRTDIRRGSDPALSNIQSWRPDGGNRFPAVATAGPAAFSKPMG